MGKFQERRARTRGGKRGSGLTEATGTTTLEAVGYVEFAATGDAAFGEYHCSECGYGVTVWRVLPRCPMCGGTSWEQSARSGRRRL